MSIQIVHVANYSMHYIDYLDGNECIQNVIEHSDCRISRVWL